MKRTKSKVRKHKAKTGSFDEVSASTFEAAYLQWITALSRMKLTAALEGDDWDKAANAVS